MSQLTFDAERLVSELSSTQLEKWAEPLASAVLAQGHALKHGHLPIWEDAVAKLPAVEESGWCVQNGTVTLRGKFEACDNELLHKALIGLMPWRKGPFAFGPVTIDTEWRSDWKWDRLADCLQPLSGRVVLDVGCGSGYHLWRMRHAGAALVLGIDPSLLYLKQFEATQRYAREPAVQFLPLPMESMPADMQIFDTVFSMGVLYHRRDPQAHLQQLGKALKPGGELVLETLVIPDQTNNSLILDTRYANMRNIYELPSVSRLENWIHQAGYRDIRTVSCEVTRRREQRSTDWMTSHSLDKALDPKDSSRTIEGHPRPRRAIVIASA